MVSEPNHPISRLFKERCGEAHDIECRMAGASTSMRETTAQTRKLITDTREVIAQADRLLQRK